MRRRMDLFLKNNICFVPVLHGRLEFALEVIRHFAAFEPDAIAVELPKTLEEVILRGVKRLPLLSVLLYEERDGTTVYLPLEPTDASVEALRLGVEHDIPCYCIDRDIEGYPYRREAFPDSYSVTKIGYRKYCELCSEKLMEQEPDRIDYLREKTMLYNLQRLSRRHKRVLFVVGMAHFGRIFSALDEPHPQPIGRVKRSGVILAQLHEKSSREILTEIPYLVAEYERKRRSILEQWKRDPMVPSLFDRLSSVDKLLKEAAEKYKKGYQEEIRPYQFRIIHKFARNYALVQGYLTPDFYQLLIAAKGGVDDNYAYEVWELGSTYPWQDHESKLPVVEVRPEELLLNQKKIRFYRQFRIKRRKRLMKVPVKKRIKERRPGEWKELWQGQFICSYPPEDLVVESWGDYVKKKVKQILSEENARVQPFVSTLLDGLDMRETLRHWHEGKIYVRENMPVRGSVGSLVLIFDEDEPGPGQEEKFPWRVTWLGEHDQESDMAFYATPAGEIMVGPGISRCQYGGFMLSYPPMRMYDIWKDSFFDLAKTKAERLLLAAIDYCEEKKVAYIAAKPPRSWCYSFANRYGKHLVYLPIGMFSPVALKKIRTFHVLDGHHVRSYADFFIT
ncbi:MAG: hypothetical protein DRG59_03170 [Deltaproteobacteria bacterium]|nr:MAG: hypothetical protein DRG59_03170 [Deltaproteobacteria bacterium]